MTTNMGADIIQRNFDEADSSMLEAVKDKTKLELMEYLKQHIRPEFLNRIDENILFTPLTKDNTVEIVDIQLNMLRKRLLQNDIKLFINPEVIDWIAEAGFDPHFGARPIKRVIQKNILNELSKELLGNKLDGSKNVVVDMFDEKVVFRKPISEEEEQEQIV